MRVIRTILMAMAFPLLLAGCSAVKIPKSIDKAKKVVRQNVEQINAITEYHDLSNPFTVLDTIKIKVPEREFGITIPKKYNQQVSDLLSEYGSLVFIEPQDEQKANEIVEKIIEESTVPIDTVFEDSVVRIEVFDSDSGLVINYRLKEQEYSEPYSYEATQIDTKVYWYEDRLFRISIVVILLTVLFLVVYNKTKK